MHQRVQGAYHVTEVSQDCGADNVLWRNKDVVRCIINLIPADFPKGNKVTDVPPVHHVHDLPYA